jgi:hypothetical protein
MKLARLIVVAVACSAAETLSAQTTRVLTPTADTYVLYDQPTSNHGGDPTLLVGNGIAWDVGIVRTLVRFDLSALPSNPGRIRSAVLCAWQFGSEPAAGGEHSDLHRLTAEWHEYGVTWESQPDHDPQVWTSALVGDSFYTGWIRWNATGLVRAHVAGQVPNLGWLLRVEYETVGASRLGYFRSREYSDPNVHPKLVVALHDLDMRVVAPIVGGVPFSVVTVECTPGAPLFLFASRTGPGTTALPALGVTLDLDHPVRLGKAVADAAGVATLVTTVPVGAIGQTLWIQSVQDAKTSNVVECTIR